MVTEEQKYKAYVLSFAGFALMTPFGKLWMDFYDVVRNIGVIGFIGYTLICGCLFLGGLILLEHGRNMLIEKRKL